MKKTNHKHKNKRRQKIKILIFIIEVVVILSLIIGAFVLSKLNKIQQEDFDKEAVENTNLTEEKKEQLTGYTEIALFGLDNRTVNDYDSGNSDVIMVVSINNDTKQINMISVYRDTYLDVSGQDEKSEYRKINAAYAQGGVEQSLCALNRNLDLDIDEYVVFDFASVATAIDILGGVEVNVTKEELEYLNYYTAYTSWYTDIDTEYALEPGYQTLTGIQAVAYSRIRYTDGLDFERTQRQRVIIDAALEKTKTTDLKTLNELVNTVFPEIRTSLSSAEMLGLVNVVLNYEIGSSYGFPFDRVIYNHSSNGSIVVPCTLESNVVKLHNILYGDVNYIPSDSVLKCSEYVLGETGMTTENALNDEYAVIDE